MKIKYDGTNKHTSFFEYFNFGIHKNDESDYFMALTLFGREWVWYIYK